MAMYMQFLRCSKEDIKKVKDVINYWMEKPNDFIERIDSHLEDLRKLFEAIKELLPHEEYFNVSKLLGTIAETLFTK